MTCVELQASLIETEDASNTEQRAHLKSCPHCTAVVRELNLIINSAVELRASNEPSPLVWNSIEIALRQEGIIRPQSGHSLLPSHGSPWGWARWLAPAAALLLITLGIYIRQHSQLEQIANVVPPQVAVAADPAAAGFNDEELMQEVAALTPTARAQYTDNLQHVNEYIQDAKSVVAANPDDQEARRSLMEAYQQKALLFELAMDRSLE